MSVIAWIVLGLAAGLLGYHLVTGQSGRSRHTGWFAHR
jgi:uncharacterized membrane protein YeaQ/YmgE (transglycosylase-associated protein family)